MAVFETWLKSDLKKPVKVERLTGNIFSRDAGANRVGAIVTDDGAPASLSGKVMGYVIRADGETVIVSGTLNGNKASILLPATCYAIVGMIEIAIKVGNTTVGACTGYVYQTTTDAMVDPGTVIPTIDELMEKISKLDDEIGDAEAWAVGQRGGKSVPATDQTYHNNAKYYAEYTGQMAKEIAEQAVAEAARDARADALKAEGHAVGQQNGANVASGSPYYENNAKYYAQKTAEDRTSTSGSSKEAQESASAAAQSAQQAAGNASAAETAKKAAEKAEADVLAAIVAAQGNDMLRMDENGDFYILEETGD